MRPWWKSNLTHRQLRHRIMPGGVETQPSSRHGPAPVVHAGPGHPPLHGASIRSHCEERSDAAIFRLRRLFSGIASQRQMRNDFQSG
jgi:hypothetical protein